MIAIEIPSTNIKERKYIIDVLFGELLCVEYNITINKAIKSYKIILENANELIIQDHFFINYSNDLEYLTKQNIPLKVEFASNTFIVEENIPIIFGTTSLEISQQKTKKLVCGIDIFASSFFMLTRWEENVNKTRDIHDRFPATASLAYKENFLDRPVVNEYVEMLWNMLKFLGFDYERKKKNQQLFLTHDIDELSMWKSWKQVFRIAIGDIVKRHSLTLAMERFAEYFLIKKGNIKDPFDTFDWLMDNSDSLGIQSRFYFMSGGVTQFDNRYTLNDPKASELIKKIQDRGHIIGIHPSYNAYNNSTQFKKEKELLEKVCGCKITEGREHYLRFEVPTTWQIWEDNGMITDSTCGYADREGFRCGTGDEFSVFNILTRKKLKLKERPLVFMDGRDYNCGGFVRETQFEHNLVTYINNQNTSVTVLFHNDIFKRNARYKDEYINTIKAYRT